MSRAKHRRQPQPPAPPTESRSVAALTTGWMLTVMTTLACSLLATFARYYVWKLDPEALGMAVLAGVMTLAAVVSGTMTLGMTAAVLKLRPERPPTSVTITAVVIGAFPWLAAAALMINRS